MIRDVTEFRRTGVASRRVTELDIPVAAWRAAMCHAGRRDCARVRTFLLPRTVDADDPRWRLELDRDESVSRRIFQTGAGTRLILFLQPETPFADPRALSPTRLSPPP